MHEKLNKIFFLRFSVHSGYDSYNIFCVFYTWLHFMHYITQAGGCFFMLILSFHKYHFKSFYYAYITLNLLDKICCTLKERYRISIVYITLWKGIHFTDDFTYIRKRIRLSKCFQIMVILVPAIVVICFHKLCTHYFDLLFKYSGAQ